MAATVESELFVGNDEDQELVGGRMVSGMPAAGPIEHGDRSIDLEPGGRSAVEFGSAGATQGYSTMGPLAGVKAVQELGAAASRQSRGSTLARVLFVGLYVIPFVIVLAGLVTLLVAVIWRGVG